MNFVKCCLIAALLLLDVQLLSANNTADSTLRLLVLGDSLSAGYGLDAKDSFPSQLQTALHKAGYSVDVINAGVSGDTSAGGLARLDWALADDPQIVIVELGGNDALRGLPPEQTYKNINAILSRLTHDGIAVILAGMEAPRNMGADYVQHFDRIYPQLAAKYAVAFYPFFLDGVALQPELNQSDGIHPNPVGVSIIVEKILPLVEKEIHALK